MLPSVSSRRASSWQLLLACSFFCSAPTALRAQNNPDVTRSVRSIAFSPDGKLLAAGSGGILYFGNPTVPGTLTVWDVAGRQMRFTLTNKAGFSSVAFSPDGKRLAAGTFSDLCYLYDSTTGKPITSFPGHGEAARAVAFSADGKTLATGSYDSKVRLWDLATGKVRMTLAGHQERIFRVAFSPDGGLLASASADGTVRVWDLKDGKALHTLGGHKTEVHDVVFVPVSVGAGKNGWLASTGWDGSIRFHDPATGKALRQLQGAGSQGCAFTPDGATLVACGDARTIQIFKVTAREATTAEGQQIRELVERLDDESYRVREKASDELRRFGWLAEPFLEKALKETTSAEVRIRARRLRRSLRTPEPEAVLHGHPENLYCLTLAPDGRILASGDLGGHIDLWDLQRRSKIATLLQPPPQSP